MTMEETDMTSDTADARPTDGDGRAAAGNGMHAAPLLGDLDTIARGLVQTYPLLTLAGAMLGGYVAARLARRVQ